MPSQLKTGVGMLRDIAAGIDAANAMWHGRPAPDSARSGPADREPTSAPPRSSAEHGHDDNSGTPHHHR